THDFAGGSHAGAGHVRIVHHGVVTAPEMDLNGRPTSLRQTEGNLTDPFSNTAGRSLAQCPDCSLQNDLFRNDVGTCTSLDAAKRYNNRIARIDRAWHKLIDARDEFGRDA